MERLREFSDVKAILIKARNSAALQERINANEMGPFMGLLSQLRGRQDEVVLEAKIHVSSVGRGARSRTLADFTPEQIQADAERAAQLFESLVITGTRRGRTETLDLVHGRLAIDEELPRASAGGHLPDREGAITALIAARSQLERDDRFGAVEVIGP